MLLLLSWGQLAFVHQSCAGGLVCSLASAPGSTGVCTGVRAKSRSPVTVGSDRGLSVVLTRKAIVIETFRVLRLPVLITEFELIPTTQVRVKMVSLSSLFRNRANPNPSATGTAGQALAGGKHDVLDSHISAVLQAEEGLSLLSVPANTVVQLSAFSQTPRGALVSLPSTTAQPLAGSSAEEAVAAAGALAGVRVMARAPGALPFAAGTSTFSFRSKITSAGARRFVIFLTFPLFSFSPRILFLLNLRFSFKDPKG